jgi:hypothetical protein
MVKVDNKIIRSHKADVGNLDTKLEDFIKLSFIMTKLDNLDAT